MKIIGILLIILTLISCEQSTDSEEEVNEKTVEIKTEYNEYDIFSNPKIEVHFTLTDKTDSTLYIFYWCRTMFEVEQFKDSSWQDYIGALCTASGAITTWEVEDHIWEEMTYIFDPGIFRIKLPIARDSSYYEINNTIRHIYSNEFIVK